MADEKLIDDIPPSLVCSGKLAEIQPTSNVTIEGDLTVKGKIIDESKQEGISYIKNIEVFPGTHMMIPIKDGTLFNIYSPSVTPKQPANVYDWTISFPICGTILLWAIFVTIWRGYQKEEYERSLPQINIDIPMPTVKPTKTTKVSER